MEFGEVAAPLGDYIKPGDLLGHLCLFRPTEYRTAVATRFGDSDVIVCDVVDLDEGVEHNGVWFYNLALRSALKPNIGKQVLGRVGQGVAKPGKSAPYIIIQADSQADSAKCADYLAGGLAALASPAAQEAKSTVLSGAEMLDPKAIEALQALLGK